jgi:putative membrane protein
MKPMNLVFSTVAALGMMLGTGVAQAQQEELNEAQILGLIVTANDSEISSGKLVATRGQKQEVKTFAAKMVVDHTASNTKIMALEQKTGIKRSDSEASKTLKRNSDNMINNLKNAKSAVFDRTYIDGQVTMHQELLTALDNTLIPKAQNPDLKSFLQDKRGTVESHLNEAKDLQSKLGTPPAAH